MKKLSKSTLLMNTLISLSIKNPHQEPILFNLGYQLEWIEPRFANIQGKLINPDIQFCSHNDKNLIFVECKCGNFEHDQSMRYKNLNKEDIIQANITALDMDVCDFEFIYFCDKENKKKLIKGEEINGYGFPIICHEDDCFTLEKNEIKGNKLKKAFSNKINLSQHIPTEFYPFSPDDTWAYISSSVFQSLLRLVGEGKEEIIVEDILKDSHPMYNLIHKNGKDKLKEKVGKIMNDLDQNEFRDVIKILKNPLRYKINSRSFKKFRDLCLKLIKDYENQKEQTLLNNWES